MITKNIAVDRMEILAIQNWYVLQCRYKTSIIENDTEISSSFSRDVLQPNHDISKISDVIVKAQFEAIMTKEVKDNYEKFLKEQEESSE
tara:strand:- start:229 stop:495 length:267 start_codon:yes stop_codon:yes gene_type:complete